MSSEIREFLMMHFEEDRSQRPEFDLGFGALRLSEMKKLAAKYGLELTDDILDPARKKDSAAAMMEAWWHQGRFPKPTKKTLAQQVAEEMTPEMLESLLEAKRGITGTAQLGPDAGEKGKKDSWVPNLEKPFAEWEFRALKSYASAQGINTHGMKHGEILDAVTALKAA